MNLGEWDGGSTVNGVAEGDPLVLQMFEQERWDVIPGAESNASVSARVSGAIERIARDHPSERVVC